jgi:hypothetical protein
MNHDPVASGEPQGLISAMLSGRGRFVLLILLFNALLTATLILSMRQQELVEEYQWVIETRTVIVEQVVTEEALEPVTVTVVVEPGFIPQAIPTQP